MPHFKPSASYCKRLYISVGITVYAPSEEGVFECGLGYFTGVLEVFIPFKGYHTGKKSLNPFWIVFLFLNSRGKWDI